MGGVCGTKKEGKKNLDDKKKNDVKMRALPDFKQDDSKESEVAEGTQRIISYMSVPNSPGQSDGPPESMLKGGMNSTSEELLNMVSIFGANIKDYSTNPSSKSNKKWGPVTYKAEVSTYEGQFSKGQRSGYGRAIYIDFSLYEGMWDRDCRNGRGIFIFEDGEYYLGNFLNDLPHGKGTQ